MNRWAHWLSLLSMVHHLFTGLTQIIPVGPPYRPASFVIIYGWLPEWLWWLWPGLYVLTGLSAAVGVRRPDAARLGLWLSAAIHFIWGCVSWYGWAANSGGTLQGSSTYWFIATVLAVLAHYVKLGTQSDRIDVQVAALAEKVEAAENGG